MAPNTSPSTGLVLSLLLLLLASSFASCPCGPPKVKTPPKPPKIKSPIPCPPTPVTPTPTPPIIGTPTPTPPTPTPPKSCPIDTLKLGVCGDLLGGLVNIIIGGASNTPCCKLLGGLADLDAALCLCTALKANVLGINLDIPIDLSLLLNYCGKGASGYKCI